MGRNLDRGLEDREERQKSEDSRKNTDTDKIIERTRKELYESFEG